MLRTFDAVLFQQSACVVYCALVRTACVMHFCCCVCPALVYTTSLINRTILYLPNNDVGRNLKMCYMCVHNTQYILSAVFQKMVYTYIKTQYSFNIQSEQTNYVICFTQWARFNIKKVLIKLSESFSKSDNSVWQKLAVLKYFWVIVSQCDMLLGRGIVSVLKSSRGTCDRNHPQFTSKNLENVFFSEKYSVSVIWKIVHRN